MTPPSYNSVRAPLPPELQIEPLRRPIDLTIAVPGSKSISNRHLVMGALAGGAVRLVGLLRCDDTHYMIQGLKDLGFDVRVDWKTKTCRVVGEGGRIPAQSAKLFAGAAGTTMRFLSAFVALGQGRFYLDGTPRMRERPIEDLLLGLRRLGVNARSELDNGCPPVIVDAAGLPGGRTEIDGSKSSQYTSAVLLVAPYAKTPMTIEVAGSLVSRPYIELTLKGMSDFGVLTATEGERIYRPTHGVKYRAGTYEIEGDATAASYFLGAAAILGGRCAVTNVSADSAQGDARFWRTLQRMGCTVRTGFLANKRGIEVYRDPKTPLKAIDVDLNDMPDVVLTLAVVCLFAEGTSTIFNVGNLRIKETDRLAALAAELRKLGATIDEGEDYLEITPGPPKAAAVETYDDHRMAMSFALAGLGQEGVTLKNPACVSKTYPEFFTDLRKL